MSCVDPSKVVVGNGHIIRVQSIGYSSIKSNCMSNTVLHLNHLTHVPKITRNLIFVSKFSMIMMHFLNSMMTSAMRNHMHLSWFYFKDLLIGVDCTPSTIFLLNLQAISSKISHNIYLFLFIIVWQITSSTKEGWTVVFKIHN